MYLSRHIGALFYGCFSHVAVSFATWHLIIKQAFYYLRCLELRVLYRAGVLRGYRLPVTKFYYKKQKMIRDEEKIPKERQL